jgi:hypothetical protein
MSSTTSEAKTQFFQFVDSPYNANYSSSGEAAVVFQLPGGPNNVVPVSGYRHVCIEVANTSITTSFSLYMGKISGSTLSERIADHQPANARINCYQIRGPEIALWLHGTPSASDSVQLWMFLTA